MADPLAPGLAEDGPSASAPAPSPPALPALVLAAGDDALARWTREVMARLPAATGPAAVRPGAVPGQGRPAQDAPLTSAPVHLTLQAYVRFPRTGDLPLATVQRLARRARVLVDACPRDADDVLDLAVAGAHGIVTWWHEADRDLVAELAEAVGDGFVLACRGPDLAEAGQMAASLGCPLLLDGAAAPAHLHGYLAGPEAAWLQPFGQWPKSAAAPGDEAVAPSAEAGAED